MGEINLLSPIKRGGTVPVGRARGYRAATIGWVVAFTGCPAVEDEPVDTDVESELPCGDAAPADCAERIDGTCFMQAIPSGDVWVLDDRNVRSVILGSECSYSPILFCPDGAHVVVPLVGGDLGAEETSPGWWEPYDGPVEFYIFDAATREMVAQARWGNRLESCDVLWWGDRAPYEDCYPMAVEAMHRTYGYCIDDYIYSGNVAECDPCRCNENQLTDLRYEGCE